MDQLLVDCGPDSGVKPGDEVVLIGSQGAETVTAQEWAERLGTISYEILCRIGPRLPAQARPRRGWAALVAPSGKRAVAYVAAGAFSAAGVAYALSHKYSGRLRRSAVPDDPDLLAPDDVVHRVFVMRDGGESHLIESGDGPPLLLLHGASLSAEVWSYQLRDLALSHRVIALDLRGHGRSTAGVEGVTISAMARDVAEVLAALDLEHAVLAGHSMGGMVCLRLTRRHPDLLGTRIGAIALIATSGGVGLPVPSWNRLAARSAARPVPERASGARVERRCQPATPATLRRASASGAGRARRRSPRHSGCSGRPSRRCPRSLSERCSVSRRGRRFATWRCPWSSPSAPATASRRLVSPRRLVASFERSSLKEYAGAGHMLMYERREEIDDLLDALSARAVAS